MATDTDTTLPSKPHFFQPLIPGFQHHFSIPVSFFKYLKGQECDKATLRSLTGKLWPVEINGWQFEDGWKDFVKNHNLHVGDFLVFRHEGNMVFDVWIFDPSTCEREIPSFEIKDEEIVFQQEEEQPAEKCTSGQKENSEVKKELIFLEKQAGYSSSKHPHFSDGMKATHLENSKPKFPEAELAKESSSWKPQKNK